MATMTIKELHGGTQQELRDAGHVVLLGASSHDHPGAVHPHRPPLTLLPDGRLSLDKPADLKPSSSSSALCHTMHCHIAMYGIHQS